MFFNKYLSLQGQVPSPLTLQRSHTTFTCSYDQGKYEEAEAMHRQALTLRGESARNGASGHADELAAQPIFPVGKQCGGQGSSLMGRRMSVKRY